MAEKNEKIINKKNIDLFNDSPAAPIKDNNKKIMIKIIIKIIIQIMI